MYFSQNHTLLILFFTLTFTDPWGKDAFLYKQKHTEPIDNQTYMLIYLRQQHLTHTDGPRSHHFPTSSEFTRLCLNKYGHLYGFLLGCDRLLRENSEVNHYPIVKYEKRILKYNPPPELVFTNATIKP
jgi:uncharacterized protein